MNVGGKSENIAKWIVSPAASLPSNVTVNVLLVFGAVFEGFKCTKNSVHFVDEAPRTFKELDAKVVPSSPTRDAVNFPLNLDPEGNLKKNDALYVHDSCTLIPSCLQPLVQYSK